MRIAGAILAIFPFSIIILVQSLAAGTANAIDKKNGDSGGSLGFLVAILFITGSALMFGKVRKGALGVWLAAGAIGWLAAATSNYSDLWVWGAVAFIYAAAVYWGIRRHSRQALNQDAELDGQAGGLPPRFDPYTGEPLNRVSRGESPAELNAPTAQPVSLVAVGENDDAGRQ
jgi:hypothetical protein